MHEGLTRSQGYLARLLGPEHLSTRAGFAPLTRLLFIISIGFVLLNILLHPRISLLGLRELWMLALFCWFCVATWGFWLRLKAMSGTAAIASAPLDVIVLAVLGAIAYLSFYASPMFVVGALPSDNLAVASLVVVTAIFTPFIAWGWQFITLLRQTAEEGANP